MLRPFLASLALVLAAPALLAAQEPAEAPGVLLDRVVAIVNDGIVSQSELDEAMATTIRRMREARQGNAQLPPIEDIRRQVLDQLVINRIQAQRAERAGITVSDEMVNEELRQLAEDNNLTLSQLPEVLERDGYNYAAFRENRREDMARQQLRRREVLQRVSITPREVDQFIERLKKSPDEQAEYNFSHILIALPADATQEQVDELAKRADEVYRRAATEDFAQLAVTFSNSQTALEGGQMGWRPGAELPTLLAETIAALKPGEVGKPISANNGFHIVKLNAMRTAQGDPVQEQTHARHILLTTNTLQDDATVRQRLSDIRRRVLAGEDFSAFASSLSIDETSAVDGGDLGWRGAGEMVPAFEAEMAKLKDGEISEPFQTEFGWHIVQVLGRRTIDVTEDMLRNRAIMQLRQSKADEQLESWTRQLREESFIEIIE